MVDAIQPTQMYAHVSPRDEPNETRPNVFHVVGVRSDRVFLIRQGSATQTAVDWPMGTFRDSFKRLYPA